MDTRGPLRIGINRSFRLWRTVLLLGVRSPLVMCLQSSGVHTFLTHEASNLLNLGVNMECFSIM
jgi:hypothetical protein